MRSNFRFTAGPRVWLPVLAAASIAVGAHGSSAEEKAAAKAPVAGDLSRAPEKTEIGKLAPDFTLIDTEGNKHTLSSYLAEGNTVVLEWFNPDCPFVKKHHMSNRSMAQTHAKFAEEKMVWLAVNSGGPGKQGHGLDRNRKAIEEYEIAYPVLLDETGAVGKTYGAKTTPQIFVVTAEGMVVYNGPLDEIANPRKLGEKNYVREVLEACCAGEDVEPTRIKSYGCSVKYAT